MDGMKAKEGSTGFVENVGRIGRGQRWTKSGVSTSHITRGGTQPWIPLPCGFKMNQELSKLAKN